MTRSELLKDTGHALKEGGIEEWARNAEWILEEVLRCRRIDLYAHPEQTVSPAEILQVEEMVGRRLRCEPLQYILGHAEFYGLRFSVDPAVLIPRPETEEMVERALTLIKDVPEPRVLDIGAGSGCIPAAIKHTRPDARVFACDVSEAALELARKNADRLGLEIQFIHADISSLEAMQHLPAGLDLITSNPPYIPDAEAGTLMPEVADFEPHVALFSGDDPLYFYRRITDLATRLLNPGGRLVFETHTSFGEQVGDLMAAAFFSQVSVEKDLAGHHRIAHGVWNGTRKG